MNFYKHEIFTHMSQQAKSVYIERHNFDDLSVADVEVSGLQLVPVKC